MLTSMITEADNTADTLLPACFMCHVPRWAQEGMSVHLRERTLRCTTVGSRLIFQTEHHFFKPNVKRRIQELFIDIPNDDDHYHHLHHRRLRHIIIIEHTDY